MEKLEITEKMQRQALLRYEITTLHTTKEWKKDCTGKDGVHKQTI